MRSQACTSIFLLCLHFGVAASAGYIANDVVSDYAQVKELLHAFYKRQARRFGHDYDPTALITEPNHDQESQDKTEGAVNRKFWNEVFENDIILTLPQAEAILKEPNPRNKRQANRDPRAFWPNLTISYEFYGGDDRWKNLIRSALRHVEQNVCVRFKENGPDRDGLKFYRGQGCWSNVGRIGGKQLVSIGYGCDGLGIVAHETLHALGLWHEQSRVDRDAYISIVADKISSGTQGNFAKRSNDNTDNLQQPYDLGSVMHYGSKAFSSDWNSDTIVTRDWRYQQTIGQREGISFKDAKMINLRYCTKVCPELPCQNNGYTDPNRCGQCRCPRGYGGTYCQDVEYTSCGETLYATSTIQTLKSGNVIPNTYCVWRIKGSGGQQVEATFDQVSYTCSNPCVSYVEVKALNSKTEAGPRLCCKSPTATIVSEGNDLVLIHRGDAEVQMGWLGFILRYKTVGNSETEAPTTVQPTTTPYWIRTASGWIHTELTDVVAPELPLTALPTKKGAEWGLWGEWSSCSQPCGGCGTRTRLRACYGGDRVCSGDRLSNEPCNSQACAKPKPGIICSGRLILPCDLIPKLTFGSNNSLNPRLRDLGISLPLPRISSRQTRSSAEEPQIHPPYFAFSSSTYVRRIKRRTSNQLCEKKFVYQCPTGLLTINIDYKPELSRDASSFEQNNECCADYSLRDGVCYANE